MEPLRASEINEIIRKQIENFDTGVTVTEVGTVIKIGDGIAELHGLEKVMAGELLEFPITSAGWHSTSKRTRLVLFCSATSKPSVKATS